MRSPTHKFYSRGKLMLTGEYLVLLGASAMALPTRFGQLMEVTSRPGDNLIRWESLEMGKSWFEGTIFTSDWTVHSTVDNKIASFLADLLKAADEINPDNLKPGKTCEVRTSLEFKREWGLGSSSSLISNVAYWFNIDPFQLMSRVAGGSGYDIAAARSNGPLVYRLKEGMPEFREVTFNPPFRYNLYFVYLGKKSDSREGVADFQRTTSPGSDAMDKCSRLTERILHASTLEEMEEYMEQHEDLVSSILGKKKISEERFPDFKGSSKSLGAWGGDFALVTWRGKREDLEEYFRGKGLDTVFAYEELIL